MRVEVICTGDEVLTGKIVNTNFSYISQKLEDVGLSVAWETTVGDDRESLLEAFRLAGARADAVIVNGGLGPTVDDLSQEVAARAAGVELVLNEEWFARMEDRFRRRNPFTAFRLAFDRRRKRRDGQERHSRVVGDHLSVDVLVAPEDGEPRPLLRTTDAPPHARPPAIARDELLTGRHQREAPAAAAAFPAFRRMRSSAYLTPFPL